MFRFSTILLVVSMLLAGCSAAVIPQPQPGYRLDAKQQSLSTERVGLRVTARVQDLQVAPYQMVDNITSFEVTVENLSGKPAELPLNRFLLVDQDGEQYRPMAPAKIVEITQKDSSYLIPYPYVGYYYLEDKEKASSFNSFESSRPFYTENHPQDIFPQALPKETIVVEAKISGLVYFVADLTTMESAELRIYPSAEMSSEPIFKFRFAVE